MKGWQIGLVIVGIAVVGFVLLNSANQTAALNAANAGAYNPLTAIANAAAGLTKAFAPSATTGKSIFSQTPVSSPSSPIVDTSSGFAITKSEQANVTAYDAQGTADAPVVGIAGIDYTQ